MLSGAAGYGWAQSPPGAYPGSNYSAAAPAQPVSEPSYAGPDSVEGTWVSDDDATPVQPPAELGIGEFEIDNSMAGGCGCSDCAAGGSCDIGCGGECAMECDPGGCGLLGGLGCRMCGGKGMCGCLGGGLLGGWCDPLWCSDMWNDVHAHRRVYAQLDYMALWQKGNLLPPLVTTSPLGTPQSQAGVLPVSATTSILFGGDRVNTNALNGGRVNLGYWLVDGEFLGIEGQYFTFQQGSTTFNATSNFSSDPNSQILARPFFNVMPSMGAAREDSEIIAFPDGFVLDTAAGSATGVLDGSIDIRATTNIQSAGALMRRLVWIDFTMQRRVDLLLGYRFFRLGDSVTINDNSLFDGTLDGSGQAITQEFTGQDLFSSRNEFHGGEIGLKAESRHGRMSVELVAKCAFGNNRQDTYIDGSTTIETTTAGSTVTTTYDGSLLTQPTNIGSYRRDVFAILPEANVNLRWDITCNLRGTIGYTFLYINRVQRSGDAIDTSVNPTQIGGDPLVGPAQPIFASTDTPWWAHSATAGVEYRW
ncbi:MAG: hypothetical protein DWQ37_16565 [Planctomycetota bacterium]|nr:MAG: hypothetical protein DWQ37_16565 [Planctomycetota bacterium]